VLAHPQLLWLKPEGESIEALLARADAAMYARKRERRTLTASGRSIVVPRALS